jgi:hypothetical protein
MKITRRQLRKLISEAMVAYPDERPPFKAYDTLRKAKHKMRYHPDLDPDIQKMMADLDPETARTGYSIQSMISDLTDDEMLALDLENEVGEEEKIARYREQDKGVFAPDETESPVTYTAQNRLNPVPNFADDIASQVEIVVADIVEKDIMNTVKRGLTGPGRVHWENRIDATEGDESVDENEWGSGKYNPDFERFKKFHQNTHNNQPAMIRLDLDRISRKLIYADANLADVVDLKKMKTGKLKPYNALYVALNSGKVPNSQDYRLSINNGYNRAWRRIYNALLRMKRKS